MNERERRGEMSGKEVVKTENEESVVFLCLCQNQLTKRLLPHGFMSLHKKYIIDVTLMFPHTYMF
jgi:hypothetical protein